MKDNESGINSLDKFLKLGDETPLLVNPVLIPIFGVREALFMQQIHYWCEINKTKDNNLKEGHYWTYNTDEDWSKELTFSAKTIFNMRRKLKKKNVLVTGNFNRANFDKTIWYRLNYEKIEEIIQQNQPNCKNYDTVSQELENDVAKITSPIPDTSSDTSSKTSKKNNAFFLSERNVHTLIKRIEEILPEKRSEKKSQELHALQIIEYYFYYFEKTRGIKHPKISEDQFNKIAYKFINGFQDSTGMWIDNLEVEDFEEMIKYHFDESALQTDYNINHFATDGVLSNAFYKKCY